MIFKNARAGGLCAPVRKDCEHSHNGAKEELRWPHGGIKSRPSQGGNEEIFRSLKEPACKKITSTGRSESSGDIAAVQILFLLWNVSSISHRSLKCRLTRALRVLPYEVHKADE